MENNYETLRMPELKALAGESGFRGYSQLRKAEFIAFLWDNEERQQRPPTPLPQMSTWEPELEVPLTKRQLKHRRNKDSKLAKKFKNMEKENSNLKSQMKALENKLTKASESTNARFKRKKIRSMKREVGKINEKRRESVKALKLLESRVPKDPISGSPTNTL